MKATFINVKNAEYYLPVLPEDMIYRATILIGAEDDEGTACGILAACEQPFGNDAESVINLLFIYVHSEYRNMGAGTAMISLLTERAIKSGMAGIQVQFQAEGERMTLWNFLKNKGFNTVRGEMDETDYKIPFRLISERLANRSFKVSENVVFLEDVNRIQWNRFQMYMNDCRKADIKGSFTLLPRNSYSQRYSCLAFNKEEVDACGLVTECGTGNIEFRNFYLAGKKRKILGKMLKEIAERIEKDRGMDVMIRVIPGATAEKVNAILSDNGVTSTDLAYLFLSF
ncbi:MAG: GNAT family N-acetyltransferase [Lachnospiraceae bacterium]|nr:GNAT family N-acetyltransferase [Lachnospiraceae bacterium]